VSSYSEISKSQSADDRARSAKSNPPPGGAPVNDPGDRCETGALRRVLRDHEFDRRLLALDLHDGLMQYLIGSLMYLDGLHDRQLPLAAEAQNQLDRARSLLRQAVVEGRRLIGGVRPPIIDEKGLTDALKDLIAKNQRSSAIAIELQVLTAGRRYSALIEGMVYRIVQEALTNIQRHSQSPRALVRLVDDDDVLRLDVRDWGVGFNVDQAGLNTCGLEGIRERAEWLGGNCEVSSSPGQGAWIIVRLPLFPSSFDLMQSRPG
jgi:signal transduction histidine kinase